jgi:hypothetical protein
MPTDEEIRAAELKAERARRRVERLERKQERDAERAASTNPTSSMSRLRRGLEATDPNRKENDR